MQTPKIRLLAIYFLLLLTIENFAQGGGPPPPGFPNPALPIDNHISLLFIAGIILGFVVIMRKKKMKI